MKNMKEFIFFAKNYLFRHHSYVAYRQALRYDKLDAEEKSKLEFGKMKRLVEYAYNHVAFYREKYDECGFHPSLLNSLSDWNLVPILEKDVVRFHPKDLLSDQYSEKDLLQYSTSGSTGTPLKVFKEKGIPVEVMGWRAFKWWGMSPAANMAKLHRNAASTFKEKLKNQILWWPTKRAYLNSASMLTEEKIKTFIREVNKNKIRWFQGYSSSIESVADYLLKEHLQVPTVDMIWWTSAPLSKLTRDKIETAYQCKVMNQYGCNEMWNIAMQKREEPYLTVCSDFVHVDIVGKQGEILPVGTKGDILITDLNCKAFPLIKYRLGDRGSMALNPLDSQDGYPKLNFVEGRTSDNIILPDGKKIDGVYLTAICDVCPDVISSYQVYQHDDFSVSLRLVLKDGVSVTHPQIDKVYKDLVKTLNGQVACRLEILKAIPSIKGKKRYIISEISLK